MGELKIAETIKELRTGKGISQEALADVCGVSMQAVSKWENGQSCPDIAFLPLLADYFQVTADYLLTGEKGRKERAEGDEGIAGIMRDSVRKDVLYIVQYFNGEILGMEEWNRKRIQENEDRVKIAFAEEFRELAKGLRVEVWGNADIGPGNTAMDMNAGGNISCGEIKGDVNAGANVECDSVGGDVNAGGSVTCGDVKGDVSAGADVKCDSVGGDVSAGASINCAAVNGDAEAGCNMDCSGIGGDAVAGRSLTCGDVGGDAKAGVSIVCEAIAGDASAAEIRKR